MIDEILSKLLYELNTDQTLPRVNTQPGSVFYTIARALALGLGQQYLDLQSLESKLLLGLGKSSDLDRQLEFVGINRHKGAPARGWVLLSANQNADLSAGSIVTDPVSGAQLRLINAVSIPPYTEVNAEVEAIDVGVLYNLAAGTTLIYPPNNLLSIVVGKYRSPLGVATTSLSGGENVESDEQYKMRASQLLIAGATTSEVALINKAREHWAVKSAYIELVRPAVVVLWVDSDTALSKEQLSNLALRLESARPAGVVLSVQQATRQFVEFSISLTSIGSDGLSVIRGAFESYLSKLQYGQSISLADLKAYAIRQGVKVTKIISPEVDVVPRPKAVFKLGTIRVLSDL